ncbi:MAG: hypothetical protein ACI9WC_002552 [Arenicella sp.]|jgi:hypothetical protein
MKKITALALFASPSLASAHTDYVAHMHIGVVSEIQALAASLGAPAAAIVLAYSMCKFFAKRKLVS